jgi:outer membrane protein assembly factor BamB
LILFLPGGGERYIRLATRIDKVFVNGKLFVDQGDYTDQRAGRMVRSTINCGSGGRMKRSAWLAAIALLAVSGSGYLAAKGPKVLTVLNPLDDGSGGADWAGYGRTHGEQHFSPLTQISDRNVKGLGLAWSIDLGNGNSVSTPLAVDGVLYFTTGYSLIHAVDAATGKKLWEYDSKAAEASGFRLRQGWGSRGIGWSNGKIFAGTHDGRLIAIDAKSGKLVWSAQTYGPDEPRYITGAPRAFRDMVIIGHGGADVAAIRGYVSAYDAETGKLRWRWHTVPGNPGDGSGGEDLDRRMVEIWRRRHRLECHHLRSGHRHRLSRHRQRFALEPQAAQPRRRRQSLSLLDRRARRKDR